MQSIGESVFWKSSTRYPSAFRSNSMLQKLWNADGSLFSDAQKKQTSQDFRTAILRAVHLNASCTHALSGKKLATWRFTECQRSHALRSQMKAGKNYQFHKSAVRTASTFRNADRPRQQLSLQEHDLCDSGSCGKQSHSRACCEHTQHPRRCQCGLRGPAGLFGRCQKSDTKRHVWIGSSLLSTHITRQNPTIHPLRCKSSHTVAPTRRNTGIVDLGAMEIRSIHGRKLWIGIAM